MLWKIKIFKKNFDYLYKMLCNTLNIIEPT